MIHTENVLHDGRPDVLVYWERIAFWWEGTRWGDLGRACMAPTRRGLTRARDLDCLRRTREKWISAACALLVSDDHEQRVRGLHFSCAPSRSKSAYAAARREGLVRADIPFKELLDARRLPVRASKGAEGQA